MQAKRKITKTPGVTIKPIHDAHKPRNIRRRPYNWEPLTILVYRNGDDVSPAKKVSFVRSDLEDWDKLLLKVSDKLNEKGFVRKLYSLSGDWIRNAGGIKNGQHYVAVGSNDQFKNVLYGKLIDRLPKEFLNSVGTHLRQQQQQQTSNSTSKSSTSSKKTTAGTSVKLPTFFKKSKLVKKEDINVKKDLGVHKKVPKTGDKETKSVSISTRPKVEYIKKPATHVGKGHPEVIKHQIAKKKVLPGAKNIKTVEPDPRETEKKKKAALHKTNQKLIKDGKSPDSEDSAYISENEERRRKKLAYESPYKAPEHQVYFAPTKKIKPKKVRVVNYDEDSGGIYRAKSQHKESKHAKEVHELRHLPVELPIDEVEATEIGDELLTRHEEETEDETKSSSDDEVRHHKHLSKEDSSDKDETSSPDSTNVQHSPKHGQKHHNEHEHEQTHDSSYPLTYTREVQPSARTA